MKQLYDEEKRILFRSNDYTSDHINANYVRDYLGIEYQTMVAYEPEENSITENHIKLLYVGTILSQECIVDIYAQNEGLIEHTIEKAFLGFDFQSNEDAQEIGILLDPPSGNYQQLGLTRRVVSDTERFDYQVTQKIWKQTNANNTFLNAQKVWIQPKPYVGIQWYDFETYCSVNGTITDYYPDTTGAWGTISLSVPKFGVSFDLECRTSIANRYLSAYFLRQRFTHVFLGIPTWYAGNIVMEQGIEYTQSAPPYCLNSSHNTVRTGISSAGKIGQIQELQFHVGNLERLRVNDV